VEAVQERMVFALPRELRQPGDGKKHAQQPGA
jgi:hypothetical protein